MRDTSDGFSGQSRYLEGGERFHGNILQFSDIVTQGDQQYPSCCVNQNFVYLWKTYTSSVSSRKETSDMISNAASTRSGTFSILNCADEVNFKKGRTSGGLSDRKYSQ
jgi:hypothetical protein